MTMTKDQLTTLVAFHMNQAELARRGVEGQTGNLEYLQGQLNHTKASMAAQQEMMELHRKAAAIFRNELVTTYGADDE